MALEWILAPSLGQLLLLSSCLYSAVVMPSYLGSSAKGSLLFRTVNNAKTKGGHLTDTSHDYVDMFVVKGQGPFHVGEGWQSHTTFRRAMWKGSWCQTWFCCLFVYGKISLWASQERKEMEQEDLEVKSARRSPLWLSLALKKILVSQECSRTWQQDAASISMCYCNVFLFSFSQSWIVQEGLLWLSQEVLGNVSSSFSSQERLHSTA